MSDPAHVDVSAPFTISDVVRASQGAALNLSREDAFRLDATRESLIESLVRNPRRVYGFNTGFGDNRNGPTIPTGQLGLIQDNLILSHASGTGGAIDNRVVRAALALRARSLTLGHSGVRSKVVTALCQLANSGLVPVVPKFGSVGASGDLAPLSHLVLPLMGKGTVDDNGTRLEARVNLLAERGVERLCYRPAEEFEGVEGPESTFGPKEGLALNNGTAFMAAHLALAVHEFENVLWHADLALALNIEALCGVMDAMEVNVQELRAHKGINASAARVSGFLKDSRLTIREGTGDGFALDSRTRDGVLDSTQDDYCLRCGPVVHGTAWDALESVKETVEIELNSVTDNPLVFGDQVLSGSHFHGMPLSFAADQLRTAMAIVGGISERRIAKLMNDKRNYGLPRHLVLDDPLGIKSGWMIAQYSAASMVNELKTRSMPYCVGNVTTGNESEDFVSMGANSCRAAYEMVEVLRHIVSVELAAAVRGILIRIERTSTPSDLSGWEDRLSSRAQAVVATFVDRGIEVWHDDDRPLNGLFDAASALVAEQRLRD